MARPTILIGGAGIAGLTAAIAFASRGFPVRVFEKATDFGDVGAGVQLSPNATKVLRRLDVLDRLTPVSVRPEAVVLKSAASLAQLAAIPLRAKGEGRWGAPYLVAHRADLHAALVAAAKDDPLIELTTNAAVQDVEFASQGVAATIIEDGISSRHNGRLLIAADGVWSNLRALTGGGKSRFSGKIAWRKTIEAVPPALDGLFLRDGEPCVAAFLHPGFHLVSYPMRGSAAINLAAFTNGSGFGETWSAVGDLNSLLKATAAIDPGLRSLFADTRQWTAFPVHVAPIRSRWTRPDGLALIGDAAHAMTPFAAQGAAMAIEDAEILASCVAATNDLGAALTTYEAIRRQRVLKVERRGALNGFAWHARGPIALGRDLVLRASGPDRLAAGLDWLYGYDAGAPVDAGG